MPWFGELQSKTLYKGKHFNSTGQALLTPLLARQEGRDYKNSSCNVSHCETSEVGGHMLLVPLDKYS